MKEKLFLLALTLFLSSSCISCGKASDKRIYISGPSIAIPNLHLNYFSKGRKDLLFRYLASSSEWHVTSINGSLLALQRESSSTCNPIVMPLPSSYPYGVIPFSGGGTLFNFSPEINRHWYAYPENKGYPENRVDEGKTISLKMEKWRSIGSSLIVEAHDKSLNLAISEGSDDISRKYTHKILTNISHQLEKLANFKSMSAQEIDSSILPLGSVKYSQDQIISIKERSRGDFIVSGYINPGKKGFVYLKVIISETPEHIFYADTSGTNAEYVGWSIDPKQKFNFCLGAASLNGYQKDQKESSKNVPADLQLWFHPSDGSPESIIFRQSMTIPAFYQ
jgi:hypothetical protein